MMGTITTEAWVLYRGDSANPKEVAPGHLQCEQITFSDITDDEVLAEPLYGCWEGNMTHALSRQPVDICQQRDEEKVVIGNAGVVRILKTGAAVDDLNEGDLCILFCNGVWDKHGYTVKVLAYDAPDTMGVLAKQIKLHRKQVIPIPDDTPYSLKQWAAFSLRYVTAWANWNVAYRAWRLQMSEDEMPRPQVWGWGGGVALAELELASHFGCDTAMTASSDKRLKLIEDNGIRPVDRRAFLDLDYNEKRYKGDADFRQQYRTAEQTFLDIVDEYTSGEGVAIYIDNIGLPVARATLKALARQGVITTMGWKRGMEISSLRAIECISRHIHVHTHYARYAEGVAAVTFAHENGWMAPLNGNGVYGWDDIPRIAEDYGSESIDSYFPIFQINPV